MTTTEAAPALQASPALRRGGGLPWRFDFVAARPWIACGLFLVLWEVAARTGLANPRWTSSPLQVADKLGAWIGTGQIWPHLLSTLEGTVLGFSIGAAIGLALGLTLGVSPTFQRLTEPYVIALYSIPSLALAPLFVVWFGISLWAKVAFSALAVLLLATFTTYHGVRNVPRDLVTTIQVMGAKPHQVIAKVMLPAAANSILLGLRTSLPMAVRATVFGELVASTEGIGYTVKHAASVYDVGQVFASLLTLAAMGILLDLLLSRVERLIRPAFETEAL